MISNCKRFTSLPCILISPFMFSFSQFFQRTPHTGLSISRSYLEHTFLENVVYTIRGSLPLMHSPQARQGHPLACIPGEMPPLLFVIIVLAT